MSIPFDHRLLIVACAIALMPPPASAAVSFDPISPTDWRISNGVVTVDGE